MNIINICLIAIVCIITAVLLKSYKQEFSIFIVIALSLVFLTWMLNALAEFQNQFNTIISDALSSPGFISAGVGSVFAVAFKSKKLIVFF